MPANPVSGSSGDDGAPMTRWERLKYAMVKPDDGDSRNASTPDDRSAEELQATIRVADDRERAVGLIAAPVSALISFIVIGADISRNSATTTAPKNFVAASTYHWVLLVFLGLAVVMLVSAWLRKRLILALSLALYGVGLFQLGWLGFAVPFVLAGAWYLVRAYRLQQAFKKAEAEEGGSTRSTARAGNGSRPKAKASRRYTPPT